MRLRLRSFAWVAAGSVLFGGCSTKRIPGTEIEDNDQTRSVLQVLEQYRRATEAKDADRVASLADPTFHDDGGTANPADDITFENLRQMLEATFKRVGEIRLDMTVKKITFEEGDVANAIFNYNASFLMRDYSQKPTLESEIKLMRLKKAGNSWKIVSGI